MSYVHNTFRFHLYWFSQTSRYCDRTAGNLKTCLLNQATLQPEGIYSLLTLYGSLVPPVTTHTIYKMIRALHYTSIIDVCVDICVMIALICTGRAVTVFTGLVQDT